jgi:cysteinyl-tRNA synthetase
MSARVEEFRPLQGNEVRMYACGPTVYDYGHIGNFRTFIAVDLLQRFLKQSGYKVRYAMNITDVDDKIIRNSARDGVPVRQYTAKYEKAFLEDAATLNIQEPVLVRATDHIPAMADFIAKLEQKDLAYHGRRLVLLSVTKFPEYGKLSEGLRRHGRQGAWMSTVRKDNARDFARGSAGAGRRRRAGIGRGRPGWHIECSVMSMDGLETFGCTPAAGSDFRTMRTKLPIRIAHPEDVRAFLVSCALSLVEGEKMSGVQTISSRCAARVLKGLEPSSIRYLRPRFLTQSTRLHLRRAETGGNLGRTPAQFPVAALNGIISASSMKGCKTGQGCR